MVFQITINFRLFKVLTVGTLLDLLRMQCYINTYATSAIQRVAAENCAITDLGGSRDTLTEAMSSR